VIVLDTNVISEMMKANPEPAVCSWLDTQPAETLYLTSVTIAELLFGIGVLPAGKRRQRLGDFVSRLPEVYDGRILAFDQDAAQHHAALAVLARKRGRGFPVPDGYIAAIAASRGFAIASRDTAPFQAVGLRVFDPWRVTT